MRYRWPSCTTPGDHTLSTLPSYLYCAWKWLCTKLGPKEAGAADGRRSSDILLTSGGSCKETGKRSNDILSTLYHRAASRPQSPYHPFLCPVEPRSSRLVYHYSVVFQSSCLAKPLRKDVHTCRTQNSRVTIGRTHTHSWPNSTLGLMALFFTYVLLGPRIHPQQLSIVYRKVLTCATASRCSKQESSPTLF